MRTDPSPAAATLLTGSTETHYHRAGCGTPVLLLSDAGERVSGRQVFRELSRHYRVIAPRPPVDVDARPAPLALTRWLRDVIDGLGLVRPALVVEEGFGMVGLRFVLLQPERVERLMVVCRDHPDPLAPDGVLADALEHSGHPLLFLRADAGAEEPTLAPEALAAAIRFLSGEGRRSRTQG